TLNIGNFASHVSTLAIYPVQFDVLKDLEPVAFLTHSPFWLLGREGLPARDMKELATWLKANPASFGIIGSGSAAHLCGITIQTQLGNSFQFVPYRGAGPATQDLVGGQIDLLCVEASNSLPHVRSGKIKAYAMLSKTRWSSAPDVPTVDEVGLPGI